MLIDSVVEQFEACPTPLGAIAFELFHGEVTRIPVSATAVPHREPGFNLLIPTAWLDPETTAANVAWTRETYARAEPHFAGRRWLNYLGDDEDEQAVRLPTARTTAGSSRSSAPTTRRTSST